MTKEYENGMIEGVRLLQSLYNMPSEERKIVFGDVGMMHIINHPESTPLYWDLLQHKEELLASHVHVGDVLKREDEEFAVTYVYPNGDKFDAITLTGAMRGNVIKETTLDAFQGYKLDDTIDTINLKETW